MHPLFGSLLQHLEALHAEMARTLDGLPPEALDWVPGPGCNSLAVLAIHVAGAERYLIGDTILRDPSNRDRAAEFRAKADTRDALLVRLETALAYSRSGLAALTLDDLSHERVAPDGRTHDVAWWLGQVLQHTANHLGHMQVQRQLWDQRHATPGRAG